MQSKYSLLIAGLIVLAGSVGYQSYIVKKESNQITTKPEMSSSKPSLSEAAFGLLPDGKQATLYTLTNSNGVVVKITDFGGAITSIITPDKNGLNGDIVLGFESIEDYVKHPSFFGALIGRYANRIDKGQFELNGEKYQLSVNDGTNHLHGGASGFDKILWQAKPFTNDKSVGIVLTHLSADGDQGYPGNLKVDAIYELTNDNELIISYKATTDKPTPINITQHPYFNLAGSGSILDHELEINAKQYTPVNSNLIPSGELSSVNGTPFDFINSHKIGTLIGDGDTQLTNGGGYDHNWVLDKAPNSQWGLDARLYEPNSGRVLEVWSDAPGIQFYSGNFLDGKINGKGVDFIHRGALCLEPQSFPDSPNKQDFPNSILQPGNEYNRKIAFKFSVK